MERVYVGNLPPDIRIKDIDDFFRPFGKLVAIDVNNRGNPAFAFVQFDSTRNALSAVRNRHGYDYEGYTLQVKLVDNNVGTGNFEVRNQRRQITPPPPPPLFNNDFNNQMGGGFGSNNNANNFGRGNSGGGNSNFGGGNRNFGGNNFGSNNSNFGPINSNFGSNNSNFGSNNSNFGANNSNFGSNNSGNFGNDNFSSSSSSFQRNTSSQNMIQYPNTNVRSIMPAQNNMIEYPNNNVWNNGSGANSNRNSNRGGGGGNFSNMGNDFNNMGGGGGDYVYNPNNNCYADNDFEDRFTQGLSGSGRKWFNRYIRKGLTPKIAREKALEHRTLPYLREGGRNQTPNNAVPNLPLPALENFGNKIMSLFSGNNAGGNFGGGGNANQMMSNFNNWGNNNNMQRGGGGFSNDFNMAGPSSSNNRSGNRNEIRSLVPMRGGAAAVNRGGRPDAGRGAEPGILEKMLAEIPTLRQQNQVASKQFKKSMDILKKLEAEESKVGLNLQEFRDKKRHKEFITEYRIWKNKQGILPLSSAASKKKEEQEEALKLRKLRTSYRNAVKHLKNFEEHDLETLSGKEKALLRICLRRKQRFDEEQGLPVATTRFDYLLTEAEEAKESKEDSETVKENADNKGKTIEQKEKQKPIATANKTPEQLQQLFQNNKRRLLKEVKRSPLGDQKRLATSGRKRLELLKENVGIDVFEGRILARLPKERLEILFTLSAEYKKKTGKCINEKTSVEQEKEEQKEEVLKLRKLRTSYRNAVKYLKNFEEHDLETLTGREKALLRVCLRRKQRFEKEQGLPVAATRFDYLLTEAKEANESKEDFESVKENAKTKDKTIEQKKEADATTTNENQDEKKEDAIEDLTNEPEDQLENEEEKAEEQNVEEKKEDAIEDLTNEPEDQVENEEEKAEDKNVEDNEEITEEQTDKGENAEEKKEE